MLKVKIDPCTDIMKDFEGSADFSPFPSACELRSPGKTRRHFVKFFLDTCYYLCVCPYKIVETVDDEKGFGYKKRRFIPQQILCAIMHFAAIWDSLSDFRLFDLTSISTRPRLYFDIFTSSVHLSVIVSFCYVMWKKADQFCDLVHRVQRCPIISLWYPRWINILLSLIAIMYMVIALLSPIFAMGKGSIETWEDWYEFHVQHGRHSLFLDDIQKSHNKTITESFQAKFPQMSFFLLSYFLQSIKWIFISQFNLIMLVMSLTLYCATNYFVCSLKCNHNCKLALMNYEALKNLSCLINDINGVITLTYTVDCIMYYATNMNTILASREWFSVFVLVIFLLTSVAWLHFASYACLQMERFRDWIRQKENRSWLPAKSVAVILLIDEISTNAVGMSGHGLFTVNYKFVAQALTTLMTYFIIVIQFK